jgi:hypothetical protein
MDVSWVALRQGLLELAGGSYAADSGCYALADSRTVSCEHSISTS